MGEHEEFLKMMTHEIPYRDPGDQTMKTLNLFGYDEGLAVDCCQCPPCLRRKTATTNSSTMLVGVLFAAVFFAYCLEGAQKVKDLHFLTQE